MKNSKLFITSLVAAAAMTSTAFAEGSDLQINGSSSNLTETKQYDNIYLTNGTLNINSGVITTGSFKGTYGNANGPTTLNIASGATLTSTGTGTSIDSNASFMLANYPNAGAVNVAGVLNVSSGLSSRDGSGTLTVQNGGIVNFVNGLSFASRDATRMVVNLENGGRINLGLGGNTGAATINLKGGTLGILGSDASATCSISSILTFTENTTTIDTTVYKMADDGNSSSATENGGTITLSGQLLGLTGTNLKLSGSGKVDFADAKIALTGEGAIAGKNFNLFQVDGTTVQNLSAANFTWNGNALSGRTEVSYSEGSVTFSGEAYNLYWKGGASGTWDTSSTAIFGKDSTSGEGTAFVAGDNIFFNTAGDVAVTISGTLTAGTIAITDGNVTFSGGSVKTTGGTTVSGTGVLNLGKNGNGSSSFLQGKLTIENGGKVNLTGGDATGYGANCINEIVIKENGELSIAKSFDAGARDGNNQTLNGGITLQGGKIKGVDASSGGYSKFDLFNANKGITTLSSTTTAEISAAIGLRNNGTFNVAHNDRVANGIDLLVSGALLSRSSAVANPTETFSATLNKTGAGTLKLTGDNQYWTTGGTINAGKIIAGSVTSLGTGTIDVKSNASLEIDIGSTNTMTQANSAKITSDNNANANLILTSGKLVLTNAENNFRGTVDIKNGAILEVGSGAKLLKDYSNQSKIWVRTGGELRMNDFSYGQLGGSPDYAVHRQLDGGKISITGTTSDSGQGFTVSSNGGTFVMEQAGQTLTLNGNGNSSTIDLGGALKIGGAGDIIINKYGSQVAISGTGSLEKIGAGTLTINAAENTYTGGTTVSEGTLVAGNASALGTGAVKIAGGQLSVASGVTLNQTAIEIVLNDTYKTTSAITGEGSIANGTTIKLSKGELDSLTTVTEMTFKIADASISSSFTKDNFTLDTGWDGWTITSYTNGVITLSVPEPSMFGLLAGLGALALVGARRRRKTK